MYPMQSTEQSQRDYEGRKEERRWTEARKEE